MSDVKEVKEIKLSAAVTEMAARVRPLLTMGDAGNLTAKDGFLAASCEGTDVTPEMVSKVNDHLTTLVSATYLAVGEEAREEFKKADHADKVTADIVLNKGLSVGVVFPYSKEVPNMDKDNPGFRTVYGSGIAKLHMAATSPTKGDFKKVRVLMSRLITEDVEAKK